MKILIKIKNNMAELNTGGGGGKGGKVRSKNRIQVLI